MKVSAKTVFWEIPHAIFQWYPITMTIILRNFSHLPQNPQRKVVLKCSKRFAGCGRDSLKRAFTVASPILQRTYPVLPGAGSTQLRIFSGIPGCDYRVSSNLAAGSNFTLTGIDFYASGNVATSNGSFTLSYGIESLTAGELAKSGGPS